MPSSLKLIFILILFYCPPSSSFDDEAADPEEAAAAQEGELPSPEQGQGPCEKCKDLDMKLVVLMGICGIILLAMLLLLPLVIYLHVKVSKAMKAGKGLLLNNNQDHATQPKMNSCVPSDPLKLCEECNIYRDFDPLPPCFCYTNEGL